MKHLPGATASFLSCFAFMLCSLVSSAKENPPLQSFILSDSSKESKTDYLEKIYFSGGTKAALTNSILMTLQELEPAMSNKTASPSLIAQYAFLDGIKSRLDGAKDACAITDMLAAGIYNLDITEAVAQNIPRPEPKVNADLSKVISTSQSLSTSTSALAWNTFALSGGKIGGLGTATKLASGASTLGNSLQTAGQIKDIAKSLFASKDRACRSVSVKEVAIDIHPSPQPLKAMVPPQPQATQSVAAGTSVNTAPVSSDKKTMITFTGVDYAKLSTIEQNIKACATVKSTSKKFNTTQSIIEVVHSGSSDDLLGLILQTCKDNFKQSNITSVEEGAVAINLAPADVKKAK